MDGPLIVPSSGLIGMPSGTKGRPRADFRADQFTALIENKGYRLAWSRATKCPCAAVNDQTQQPDPNCDLCEGKGWIWFAPTETVIEDTAGELDEVQTLIVEQQNAGVIRGIMTGLTKRQRAYTEIGKWVEGDVSVTVRPENSLGYWDRLTNLDSEMIYVETVRVGYSRTGVAGGEDDPLDLRYLVSHVNQVRTVDAVLEAGGDYGVEDGQIVWLPGRSPGAGTRVNVHYLMHPSWLVIEHPHAIRTTLRALKTKAPTTPQGDPVALPLQAHARLEFMVR